MALLMACQKEPSGPPSAAAPEERLEPRIRAFVERATSGQRDGAGSMSADSAEWYVEAALNYSNADLTIEYNDAEVDSITYTIPLENGMADEADAIAAYNALNPVVATSNDEGISHVVIVDVTSQNTADELILTVAYVVGSGYEKALNTAYGPADFWQWVSYGAGTSAACSTNTSPSNLGADKRVQQRINNELTALGNNVFMVSVETWTVGHASNGQPNFKLYSNYPDPASPHGWRTYACTGGCDYCLTPSMMTYYTQGTWDVMNLIKAQHCPTKRAQQCTIDGQLITVPTTFFHRAQYRYGIIPK